MNRTLVGLYRDPAQAEQVRQDLLAQGFDDDEVEIRASTDQDVQGRASEESGGIVGFFKSLFSDDDDEGYSGRYSQAMQSGNVLVTVDAQTDEQIEQAQQVMNRHAPVDLDVDMPHADMQSESGRDREDISARAMQPEQTQSIPVVEEELQVGKRVISRGGVRVVSRISEQPVEESVRLREERATIERTPVDRPATQADLRAMEDGVIEVRETAEEPVVAKRARVVEEVRVGKQVEERTETVRDTVRHTEVDVEHLTPQDREDFRGHWQSTAGAQGGEYEDYEPAYRYGASLESDERYRGRDWDDVSAEVQRDWESRNPGSWDRMKDNIRYGWGRGRR